MKPISRGMILLFCVMAFSMILACSARDVEKGGIRFLGAATDQDQNAMDQYEADSRPALSIELPAENSFMNKDSDPSERIVSGKCSEDGHDVQIRTVDNRVLSTGQCLRGRWTSKPLDLTSIDSDSFQIFAVIKDENRHERMASRRYRMQGKKK